MRYDGIFEQLRAELSGICGQPIEAAVMVHKSPDQPTRGGPRLAINNHLALTPTHLRLHRLGGRTGMKVKDEVQAWDRRSVRVEVCDAARSSWFASTGSSYDFDVHSLRITGPEGTLVVDVMQENHFMDPKIEIQRLLVALGP
ncbi:MAG TPA: hypothetical protein VGO60_03810 [Iamia sp.]|jgi:hypothetical protein|nr:hypothetical protein [Iamia sp.]